MLLVNHLFSNIFEECPSSDDVLVLLREKKLIAFLLTNVLSIFGHFKTQEDFLKSALVVKLVYFLVASVNHMIVVFPIYHFLLIQSVFLSKQQESFIGILRYFNDNHLSIHDAFLSTSSD